MSHHRVDRRAFLKNAGLTALVGSAASDASLLAAVSTAATAPATTVYDFDTIYNRLGTDCIKWDRPTNTYGKGSIDVGMGIADMDFRAAPAITKAMQTRLQHENWGYLEMPGAYVESIINWNKRRYNVEIKKEWLMHSCGVHPALISAMRAFSPPGSKVIVQTPTYNAFFSDIALVGCKAEENPLKLVNGRYAMDFDDLERRIDHDTHALILCNPQNPTGNCWSRADLTTLGEICTRRRVVVFADEIHCDFINKGSAYTPYSSLANEAVVRNSITFKSASKSFNLAATKVAYLFSTNPAYLDRLRTAGHLRQELNTLGVVACQAAYNECEDWLNQVVTYIDGTHDYVEQFVRTKLPLVKYVKPQGTYLAWLDVSGIVDTIGAKEMIEVERYLAQRARIHVNHGAQYGRGGVGHVRMNIATSRKLVERALTNIAGALRA